MKKKILKRIGIVMLVLIGIGFVFAKVKRITPLSWGHKEVNTPMFGNEAINGYDAVAYFTKEQAVKGDKTFSQNWKGANWYFSSAENLNLFKSNPEKYAPQFGGYCAFAVNKGFTANSDPNAFKIINDKLYLCADKKILEKWIAGPVQIKEPGSVQLTGEVLDPKCYFGVMKAGHAKPHRDCAIRWIAGGMSPVFWVRNEKGVSHYYLIPDEDWKKWMMN